jgi:hypothetical protein
MIFTRNITNTSIMLSLGKIYLLLTLTNNHDKYTYHKWTCPSFNLDKKHSSFVGKLFKISTDGITNYAGHDLSSTDVAVYLGLHWLHR